MNKTIQNTESTVDKAIDFYNHDDNHDKLVAIDDIKNPMAELVSIKQGYIIAAKNQLAPHTTRKAVDAAKKAFADKLRVKLDLVHATVKKSGDATLLELVEKPISFILDATKGEASINALLIIEALETNLNTILKNKLTKANIDELKALLKAYDDIKDLPIESRNKKKVKGTNVLTALNKQAKDIFKDLRKSVNGNFAEDTTFRDSFLAALTIPKVPRISNNANITLLDEEGNPFTENARAYDIKSKAKKIPSYKANTNGVIPFKGHKVGKFPIKIVIKGKEDIVVTINFKKGETVEVTVTVKESN